jgi:cytochrome P450
VLYTEGDATKVFTDPTAFADEARLHSALRYLRAEAPVSFVDQPFYRPFWAIVKHADIMEIERKNTLWINGPRSALFTAEADELNQAQREAGTGLYMLIHMDGRHHRVMRAIGADWFRPKAMRALKGTVDKLAKQYVDKMSDRTQFDFVTEVAANFPLYIILSLLGLPEADFPYLLMLTQQVFGRDDKELQRGASRHGYHEAVADLFTYFSALTASRRADPTDDLASAIANARIDGDYLPDIEVVSYYTVIATAGHDTTSAAISGGLRALTEHPNELDRLQSRPELMATAVEEILRWSTPGKHFMRTATENTEVRGVPIAAGQSVYLSYVSANRDEDVFPEPFCFDITRDPNKHLTFGHGVHFCLGAALARMEISSFFAELLPRLKAIELAGAPVLSDTIFVGGLKHLPIRYQLR